MAESKLHRKLKKKARNYLFNKGHRVVKTEVDGGFYGIYDVWGIRKGDYSSTGIEVKVSRGDWKASKYKELKLGVDWCYTSANENYILCSAGLIQPEEIEKNWGLLWYKDGKLRNKKKPFFIKVPLHRKLETLINFLEYQK